MDRIVVAGTSSGTGKTTVTAGLLAALRRRGHSVSPFKVGPDYIDPGFHTLAAGTAARNLDSWILPPSRVLEVLGRSVPRGYLAVVEGVMGLYDGRRGEGEVGSTAHVAKITKTPVILVAGGAKMARSAAALAGGYLHFDPELKFAGVIFNFVSGESHFRLLKEAVEEHLGLPVFGYLPKDMDIALPERHLGLLPAGETQGLKQMLDRLAAMIENTVDVEAIMTAAASAGPLPPVPDPVFPPQPAGSVCTIAVARDEAFNFYYPENLELLAAYGAELKWFSPLRDASLPAATDGVYIGGGFPEMFADRLAANKTLREQLARQAGLGMPVYSECGGYMYLCRELVDFGGRSFPMAGVFPGRAVMQDKRQRLGYSEVTAAIETFFLQPGETCRGHEFHWSLVEGPGNRPLYRRLPDKGAAGEYVNNCAGSYVHLHFLSNPAVAERFVATCSRFGKGER